MIDITLLGTSALLPLPDRALTAAHLSCAGRSILFDCGEGTQAAARGAHVSLMKTDVIALTHYHGDHVFGLPGLLQTMGSMDRTEPLLITGPAGLKAAMEPILRLAEWLPFEVTLRETPSEGLDLPALFPGWPSRARLSAFPTRHRVPSQCYQFLLGRSGAFQPEKARALGLPVQMWGVLQRGESVLHNGAQILPGQVMGPDREGLKFVFSGDTSPCPGLLEAAEDADLLICEATYGENEQADLAAEYGHMTFFQAGQTAAQAHVRRLWLAHYSQRIEDPEAFLPLAQAAFPPAQCGQDGMKITLQFRE